jgi:hypothetical protein
MTTRHTQFGGVPGTPFSLFDQKLSAFVWEGIPPPFIPANSPEIGLPGVPFLTFLPPIFAFRGPRTLPPLLAFAPTFLSLGDAGLASPSHAPPGSPFAHPQLPYLERSGRRKSFAQGFCFLFF